jgi:tight adherence protein C
MSVLLLFLASACAFGAMAAFAYWLLSSATEQYFEGEQRLGAYVVKRDDAAAEFSLASLAKKVGVIFLPVNETLRDADRFGLPLALGRWEHSLVRAGLRTYITPEQFLGMCQVSALAGGFIFALVAIIVGLGPTGALFLGFPVGLVVGFFVPNYLLKNLALERVAIIEKRLPFAIEFMLLAMEASAALPDAMGVYVEQMPGDPLAEEFGLALTDIDRGLSQTAALKAMGERVDSDTLSAFILSLTVGLDTGQPIKEVLQTQATAARLRRFQGAEEVAKTASTKAVFPLMIVMISVLILLLGPMGLRMMQGGLF